MVRQARGLTATDGGVGQIEQMTIQMASVTRDLLSNCGAYPARGCYLFARSAILTNGELKGDSLMPNPLPDPSTPFGERVLRRLRDERVIWLTAVDAAGTPQPNPVWFYWDGETVLVYNRPDAKRLQHIRRNPRVSLNFDSDGSGDDIVVLTCLAQVNPDGPPATAAAAYLEKYRTEIPGIGQTPESLAAEYSVALRISITKVRGF